MQEHDSREGGVRVKQEARTELSRITSGTVIDSTIFTNIRDNVTRTSKSVDQSLQSKSRESLKIPERNLGVGNT